MDMPNHASGDLDNLSNLLINSYEDDAAALDAYELEMERNLQENLLLEKEHHNQRLFQSFQKSACNVAQMFKDKGSPQQAQAVLSSWESFQNAAGAITVLYKESLEACRVHMELGVHLGQQRKLKDIISWVKKKKKRSIRKDELVSFLIGKQYPSKIPPGLPRSFSPDPNPSLRPGQNQMFNLFGSQASNPFNVMSSGDSSGPSMFAGHRHGRAQQLRQQQQQQRNTLISTSSGNSSISGGQTSNNTANSVNSMLAGSCQAPNQPQLNAAAQLNLIGGNDNSNGSEVETNSDLATFREALIMHSKCMGAVCGRFPEPTGFSKE